MSRRLVIALVALALSVTAQAAEVPHYVNFQSVLRDDSGNLIEDGFMDLQLKILDQDKDVVYEETQPGVQVVRSAINVMIGEGVVPGSSPAAPTGGIPANVLDPEKGSHFLQVQFGSNLPSDPMELGSVPYAMYAEKALGLAPTTPPGNLPDYLVTQDELDAAIASAESDNLTTATAFGGNPSSDVTGTYDNLQLKTDSVGSNEIASSAVGASEIANGSITTSDLNSGSFSGWDQDESNDLLQDGSRSMTGSLDMGSHNVTNIGSVDGVDLSLVTSALNPNGSIKGAGYSAIGMKIARNVAAGTNLCVNRYMPTGFSPSDCGTAIQFIPMIAFYPGDSGGTDNLIVNVDSSFILNICSDSNCSSSNKATVLVVGLRNAVEVVEDP